MKIEDEIKSKFRNESHKALVNLYYTNNFVSQHFFKLLKDQGLAAAQFNVLRILKGQHPNEVSIGIIKERMLDKNSDTSRIIDRLFAKKLVERKESKNDRRKKDVLITNKGIEVLGKLKSFEKLEDTILANFSQNELFQLNYLLDKIRCQ